jgi:hypothetical protein
MLRILVTQNPSYLQVAYPKKNGELVVYVENLKSGRLQLDERNGNWWLGQSTSKTNALRRAALLSFF